MDKNKNIFGALRGVWGEGAKISCDKKKKANRTITDNILALRALKTTMEGNEERRDYINLNENGTAAEKLLMDQLKSKTK